MLSRLIKVSALRRVMRTVCRRAAGGAAWHSSVTCAVDKDRGRPTSCARHHLEALAPVLVWVLILTTDTALILLGLLLHKLCMGIENYRNNQFDKE